MSEQPLERRDLIAGIIATVVKSDDHIGIERAAMMVDAAFQRTILDAARHAHAAGCERCGEIVMRLVAAKNSSDEELYDAVSNELVSHMSLESDLLGDTEWLNDDGQ